MATTYDPYVTLAYAMIEQAVRDCKSKHHVAEALFWLATEAPCWFYLLDLGVQPGKYDDFVDAHAAPGYARTARLIRAILFENGGFVMDEINISPEVFARVTEGLGLDDPEKRAKFEEALRVELNPDSAIQRVAARLKESQNDLKAQYLEDARAARGKGMRNGEAIKEKYRRLGLDVDRISLTIPDKEPETEATILEPEAERLKAEYLAAARAVRGQGMAAGQVVKDKYRAMGVPVDSISLWR